MEHFHENDWQMTDRATDTTAIKSTFVKAGLPAQQKVQR